MAVIRGSGPRSLLSQTAEALAKARNAIAAGPAILIASDANSAQPVTACEILHQIPIFTVVPPEDTVDRTASSLSRGRRALLVLGGNC